MKIYVHAMGQIILVGQTESQRPPIVGEQIRLGIDGYPRLFEVHNVLWDIYGGKVDIEVN